MGTFADSIRANCDKKLEQINTKCYNIVTELFNNIVYDTPVLDGYLKNSWFTATGNKFSSQLGLTPDSGGSGSLMNIQSLRQARAFYKKDGVVTMTNNQPYAYRIEYLGWSKYKAPYGMVRINLLTVASKYK